MSRLINYILNSNVSRRKKRQIIKLVDWTIRGHRDLVLSVMSAKNLKSAFRWAWTRQGLAYWHELHLRLECRD